MANAAAPQVADRATWQKQIEELRVREKAHTREGDAIAAARRRLPMVEIDANTPLVGSKGTVSLLDAFEGRKQLFASYHMWNTGEDASQQCEGCTFFTSQATELSYLHSRDVTFAIFCQGPFEESNRYRKFMGYQMPWYSVPEDSWNGLHLEGLHTFGMKACYLRDEEGRVFETYWTTRRGTEPTSSSYGMLDMTVYGRQEDWEDVPEGWPKRFSAAARDGDQFRSEGGEKLKSGPTLKGRPISQWSRLAAGRSDDIGATSVSVK